MHCLFMRNGRKSEVSRRVLLHLLMRFVIEPYDDALAENQNDNVLATRGGMFVILVP